MNDMTIIKDPKEFGAWVKALRAEFDLRQIDLAVLAGIGESSVRNVEQGKLSRRTTREALRKAEKELRRRANDDGASTTTSVKLETDFIKGR